MIIEEPIEDVTVLHASQDPRTAVYHARLTRLLTVFPHGAAPQVGHYPCHPARRKATSTLLPHGGVCSLVDQVRPQDYTSSGAPAQDHSHPYQGEELGGLVGPCPVVVLRARMHVILFPSFFVCMTAQFETAAYQF